MLLRLGLLLVVISAFAIGFSELARLSARVQTASSPCSKWSNPECRTLSSASRE
jgi:hypothetical protein